ncbi:DUF262 domain-containing protein [Fructilactobacillus florum]|uniref:DUF262 domain-containing protein n=1 Tax=Fructilactobacillus florum TaxID=640331 RepID=UPI000A8DAB59|nr:DUF262 domain-containing protein [Fructilactobacillus florum]
MSLIFLKNDNVILEIPVFQRHYEWSTDQCETLFADLEQIVDSQKEHFFGTIVYVSYREINVKETKQMIDGQQRLTTLMLLICALRNSDKQLSDQCDQYLLNSRLSDNERVKLKSVERDRMAFMSIVQERSAEIQSESNSKLVANYRLFCHRVSQSTFSARTLLDALRQLIIVNIELTLGPDSENPEVVFESLNSTGLSLSATDLIRNYLLMQVGPDEQRNLYQNYWVKLEQLFAGADFTEFIWRYLIMSMHASHPIKKSDVYHGYQQFFIAQHWNPQQALTDLLRFAYYYVHFQQSQTDNPEINHSLEIINRMKSKVVYPYLLMLQDQVVKNRLSKADWIKIVQTLTNYLFRLKICQLSTAGLNSIISNLCVLPAATTGFYQRELTLLRNRFVSDRDFTETLKTTDIYRESDLAKLTLELLEQHRSKETIDFTDAQIEHVMPQTLSNDWRLAVVNVDSFHDRYVNTLGNLTLTKYNQEMSNAPFDKKRAVYQKSNIMITRNIPSDYDIWNATSIAKRTAQLTQELLEIFPFPTFAVKNNGVQSGTYRIDTAINVTGKKPVNIMIQGKNYRISSWQEFLFTFMNYLVTNKPSKYQIARNDVALKRQFFTNLRKPKKLVNGDELERNLSANHIKAFVTKVAEIADLSNQIFYTIR